MAVGRAPVIAALDMGYGHLRAAASVASALGAQVAWADRPPLATDAEAATWRRARRWYEGLSRAADAGFLPGARAALDLLTRIPDARDPSAPSVGARRLAQFIGEGLGSGLASRLRDSGESLLATFYAPAIAADAHGAARVHLVVTDADVNRVWAPVDARRSAITYFAPTEGAAARLASYGVALERVRVTGFPLPPELVGPGHEHARRALAARIARLDPNRRFRDARAAELVESLGDAALRASDGPPTIVFAVGGAGAQAGVARALLGALREPLRERRLRLVLVAGVRLEVAARFERWIAQARAGDAASVLVETDFAAYYRRFNETLAAADVLWTKPSELTFYAALGIPLLCARPLGAHEERNRDWAARLGAALDASDTAAAAARLPALLADGTLAAMAWAGYRSMPRDGTERIREELLRG